MEQLECDKLDIGDKLKANLCFRNNDDLMESEEIIVKLIDEMKDFPGTYNHNTPGTYWKYVLVLTGHRKNRKYVFPNENLIEKIN